MIQKILLINGNPNSENDTLNNFQNKLYQLLGNEGFEVDLQILSEKEINSCVGCWDCWWKTPGVCRLKDDAAGLLQKVINSDLLIFSSPLIMGMYSALLKRFHDRIIPLVHPYIEIIEGECHHKKRYPKYPKMGVLIENGDASADEIENVKFIFNRIALNFHSEIKFFKSLNNSSIKEISHAISCI